MTTASKTDAKDESCKYAGKKNYKRENPEYNMVKQIGNDLMERRWKTSVSL